jgi:hypothetical protein
MAVFTHVTDSSENPKHAVGSLDPSFCSYTPVPADEESIMRTIDEINERMDACGNERHNMDTCMLSLHDSSAEASSEAAAVDTFQNGVSAGHCASCQSDDLREGTSMHDRQSGYPTVFSFPANQCYWPCCAT